VDERDEDPYGWRPVRSRDTPSPTLSRSKSRVKSSDVDSTEGSPAPPSPEKQFPKQRALLFQLERNKSVSDVQDSPGRSSRGGGGGIGSGKMLRRANTVGNGGQGRRTYEDEEGYGSAEHEDALLPPVEIDDPRAYRIRVKLHYKDDVRGMVGFYFSPLFTFFCDIDYEGWCAEYLVGNDSCDLCRQGTDQVSKDSSGLQVRGRGRCLCHHFGRVGLGIW
jgi:hypothetical protein